MDSQDVVLTREILEQGLSVNGAYNFDQLEILGVEIPLKSGWRRRLIGKVISAQDVQRFLALKNAHLSANKIASKQKPDSTSSRNLGYVWKEQGDLDWNPIKHDSPIFVDVCGKTWALFNRFLGEDGEYEDKPVLGVKYEEQQLQYFKERRQVLRKELEGEFQEGDVTITDQSEPDRFIYRFEIVHANGLEAKVAWRESDFIRSGDSIVIQSARNIKKQMGLPL